MLVSGLFFVPQIIRNASEGHHFPKDYNYVLGLGLSRILIPVTLTPLSQQKLTDD